MWAAFPGGWWSQAEGARVGGLLDSFPALPELGSRNLFLGQWSLLGKLLWSQWWHRRGSRVYLQYCKSPTLEPGSLLWARMTPERPGRTGCLSPTAQRPRTGRAEFWWAKHRDIGLHSEGTRRDKSFNCGRLGLGWSDQLIKSCYCRREPLQVCELWGEGGHCRRPGARKASPAVTVRMNGCCRRDCPSVPHPRSPRGGSVPSQPCLTQGSSRIIWG